MWGKKDKSNKTKSWFSENKTNTPLAKMRMSREKAERQEQHNEKLV